MYLVGGHPPKKAKLDPSDHIFFLDKYYEDVQPGHNDALIFQLDITDQDVMKVLIDNGSSVDILYFHTFKRMFLDGYVLEDGDRTRCMILGVIPYLSGGDNTSRSLRYVTATDRVDGQILCNRRCRSGKKN